MNKAVTLTSREAHHKARAEHYSAEAQKILRQLSAERVRHNRRRRTTSTSIVDEVKSILQGV